MELVTENLYTPLLEPRKEGVVVVEGPRGTGKTFGILCRLIWFGMQHPKARLFLARRYRATLTETILPTLENHVFPAFGCHYPSQSNRSHYILRGGAKLVPIGVDDGAKLTSSEWTMGYIAQAEELTFSEFDSVRAVMRHFVDVEEGNPFSQLILDANTADPGHWLNVRSQAVPPEIRFPGLPPPDRAQFNILQRFNEDVATEGYKRIVCRHQHNPAYWNRKEWNWTPAGRKYIEEVLNQYTGHMRSRWLDGLWVAAEGQVFPEFSEAKHVCDDFDPPPEWPWFIGWDPGYAHPTGIMFLTVGPDGTVFVVDEIYQGGRSVQEHAREVLEKLRGRTLRRLFGDPHEFFSTRAQGKSVDVQAQECGLPQATPWANQKKGAMVNALRDKLNRGGIQVMRRCKNTIMEFQTWAFKRKPDGSLPAGDDAYEDANNHLVGDPLVGMESTNQLTYTTRPFIS